MFGIETFFSMLFVKCRTRGEQLGVVIGMLILIAACYGVGKFLLGLGEAGAETMQQAADMELRSRRSHSGITRVTFFGYGGAAISALLALVFGLVALINTIRFITGTGLDDSDESW